MSNLWVTRGPYRTIPNWPEFSINQHGVVCRGAAPSEKTSAKALRGTLRKPQSGKTIASSFYRFASEDGRSHYIRVTRLMADVWGVKFKVGRDWLDLVRAAVVEYNTKKRAVRAAGARAKYKVGARPCRRCGRPLPEGYHRQCPDCIRTLEASGDGTSWFPGRIGNVGYGGW